MHLDVSKIDDRIQRLQEVKRIAKDPELLQMITEFIVFSDRPAETNARPAEEPVPVPKMPVAAAPGAPRPEDTDVVNQLMKDMDSAAGGSSLWSRTRAGKGA